MAGFATRTPYDSSDIDEEELSECVPKERRAPESLIP